MSNSSTIFQHLRSSIEEGKYDPGEFLSPQKIAEENSLSGVPVREALLRLSERQLVVWERNRGFSIAKISKRETEFFYNQIWHAYIFAIRRLRESQHDFSNINDEFSNTKDKLHFSVDDYKAIFLRVLETLFGNEEREYVEDLYGRVWFVRRLYLNQEKQRSRLAHSHRKLIKLISLRRWSEAEKVVDQQFRNILQKVDTCYF